MDQDSISFHYYLLSGYMLTLLILILTPHGGCFRGFQFVFSIFRCISKCLFDTYWLARWAYQCSLGCLFLFVFSRFIACLNVTLRLCGTIVRVLISLWWYSVFPLSSFPISFEHRWPESELGVCLPPLYHLLILRYRPCNFRFSHRSAS